ncbi:substrate-binding periplasmic protein [Roseateles saccharophilus]|uniref:Polar amino acid transport system substrate-binding protein n=1 Tax=Roseateles saccharophilus TaxID=304 RepID=A0A4R3UPS7_ROSSA|nr:transporter substrate-binding domain-containing protein [Roseateles saccharophilus]TCU93786.1 polar amino acid transport system substrate-binding protein [Roseateles saccharophilus]
MCAIAGLTAAWAEAGCQRSIDVPMAPIGLSVSFDGERAGGIYPTLLRELAASAGCEFQIRRVPRARLLKMFEAGEADLLIPASASPAREQDGEFVPLIQVRASLLMLSRERPAPRSLAELVARSDYRLAVVRGFSFGTAYDGAVATLREQKRLVEEADAAGVARALRLGIAQASVMTASIFVSTLITEPDLAPLLKQVRSEPLEELGWSESGVYLSRLRLSEADRRTLRQAFGQAAKTGRVWQLFNDSYPPGSLGGSIRPN